MTVLSLSWVLKTVLNSSEINDRQTVLNSSEINDRKRPLDGTKSKELSLGETLRPAGVDLRTVINELVLSLRDTRFTGRPLLPLLAASFRQF